MKCDKRDTRTFDPAVATALETPAAAAGVARQAMTAPPVAEVAPAAKARGAEAKMRVEVARAATARVAAATARVAAATAWEA